MPIVNMLEAKTNLSRLVEAVEAGLEKEVVIARNGRPAARLVPIEGGKPRVQLGVAKGKLAVPDDIDDRNEEVRRLFEGKV